MTEKVIFPEKKIGTFNNMSIHMSELKIPVFTESEKAMLDWLKLSEHRKDRTIFGNQTITLEHIIRYMLFEFIREVEEKSKSKDAYYYKWIGGWRIAKHYGVKATTVRRILKKAEKYGFVKSTKNSTCILWTVEYDGFIPHPQFKDYLIKKEQTI